MTVVNIEIPFRLFLDMCVLEFNHLEKTKGISNTNLYFLVAMKTVYKCYKHTQPGP